MKRLPALCCTVLLCSALAGCAYDPYAPPVAGSVAFGSGGIYGGTVSVGTAYHATPLLFPILPPVHWHHAPPPGHRPPALRPGPVHRPPALAPRPHGGPRHPAPSLHHGKPHGPKPPMLRPGQSGPRPHAVRPGGHKGPRPAAARPSARPSSPHGGHRGPGPR